MDISLIVAKVLGTYLVVSGLFLMTRGKTIPLLLKDFFGHPAIVYLTGITLVTLSALLLVENNIWDGTWRTLITVSAWIIFLKGLAYIFVPDALHKVVSQKFRDSFNLYGLITVIVGLNLFFQG